MRIPKKRLRSGFEMPVFGIGTWKVGGGAVRDPLNDDKKDIDAIKWAVAMGVSHIDTAEIYADGYAEILVGKAVRGVKRERLFIVSKVAPQNLTYDGIISSARGSIGRLGVKYLDLYLIHAPNPSIPMKESMRAMDSLMEQGLIRNIGVSNFAPGRLEEAQSHTKNRIVANQVHYNLIVREAERKGVLRHCQDNDIMLIAYRPVELGRLARPGIPLLDGMAGKYGKSQAQIAINWLISQPSVVTLSKTSNINHLMENLGAVGWGMENSDVETLRASFPGQQAVSDVAPLM